MRKRRERKWRRWVGLGVAVFVALPLVVFASSSVQELTSTKYLKTSITIVKPVAFGNATVSSYWTLNTTNTMLGYLLAGNQSTLTGGLNGSVANLTYLAGGSSKLASGFPVNATAICYTTTVTTGALTKACTPGSTSLAYGNYSLQFNLTVTSNTPAPHPPAGFDVQVTVQYCFGTPANKASCVTHETVSGTGYIGSAYTYSATLHLFFGLGVAFKPSVISSTIHFNYCPNSAHPLGLTYCP